MRKIAFIMALTLGMALLAGCSSSAQQTTAAAPAEGSTADQTLGGWEILDAESVLSADESAIFEKAAEGWTGAEFDPVAVIATQVVAGTNYCFLAKVTAVTATPESHYAFVYVYADLEGNAKISGTKDIEINVDDSEDTGDTTEGLAGGWAIADLDGIKVQNQDKLEKALEGFVGSKLAPIACIASQVVSGTNYCFVVKETRVTAQPVSYIALVYVYEDLEGNAEILNVHTINHMPEE